MDLNTATRPYKAINLAEKFGLFSEQWSPKVVAELNDYQFKIVRIEGDFIWHDHSETDEAFFVLDGELRIDFRDGFVLLKPGEMFVVPRGVEHRPFAAREVKLLLIEPRGILNTGHAGGERIAANDVWIRAGGSSSARFPSRENVIACLTCRVCRYRIAALSSSGSLNRRLS